MYLVSRLRPLCGFAPDLPWRLPRVKIGVMAAPWRTEGLPKKDEEAPKPKRRWWTMLAWGLGYLIFFGVLTLQDRWSGPQAVPYTEFKTQVSAKNIAEVFARVKRAPDALYDRLVEVPGVAQVETRIVESVTLDVPGLDEPAVGQLISTLPKWLVATITAINFF